MYMYRDLWYFNSMRTPSRLDLRVPCLRPHLDSAQNNDGDRPRTDREGTNGKWTVLGLSKSKRTYGHFQPKTTRTTCHFLARECMKPGTQSQSSRPPRHAT
ncbi:hypothetical protein F444_03856 [Phytophthora nicotianae P1976]|uniref:Uncharacterized protein n=1 Tax=Phytophthora nicotianae P1976 TaxID=1317066 RepID=A0A081ASM7_PHYNI|nr:hypothetical protein F444_03856 [Phytophthora nicotianae P1976]